MKFRPKDTHNSTKIYGLFNRNELWTRIMTPKVMKSYSDYILINSISLQKDPVRRYTFETLPNLADSGVFQMCTSVRQPFPKSSNEVHLTGLIFYFKFLVSRDLK